MRDQDRTKQELIEELQQLRGRVAELEAGLAPSGKAGTVDGEVGGDPGEALYKVERHARATNQLLRLMADASCRQDFLDGVVESLREWTGCRCTGIRILDSEGNIPYGSYLGFDSAFWEKENWLSISRDNCACTRVIAGVPEPQDACCMTANGSFVLNDSRKLVESLTEEELTRFRGICIRSGFVSIAVIPIRYKGDLVGGIHLADERAEMVPGEQVKFLEKLSPLIGEGIIKFNSKDALEKQKELLHEVVNGIPVMLCFFGPNGNPLLLNPEFQRLLGWSLEDARKADFLAMCYPDSEYRRKAIEYMRKGTAEWREFSIRTKSGEYIDTAWSNVRLKDGSHIGIGIDLRERKQSEKALRKSEELFRTSIGNMIDCFGIFSAIRSDSGSIVDFRIEYLNGAACHNNRMTSEEQVGKQLLKLFPSHRGTGLFDAYRQVVEMGDPFEREMFFCEDTFGIQQESRVFDIRAAKLGDGFVASWRDVTGRVRAQEALFKREREFEALVENSPDIICRLDRELRYLYVSPAMELALRVKADSCVGKSNFELSLPDHPMQLFNDALQRVLDTGQGHTVELEVPVPEGLCYMEVRIVPEFARDGSIESLMTIGRDITEKRKVQIKLERATRALRVLSESNYSLAREREEIELLTHVCRIITETGGYALAWVGYAEENDSRAVRPVARWGPGAGYVDSIQVSWSDNESGCGPTGRAIREGKLQTSRNFRTDPHLSPWREIAIRYGFYSSAAFPLIIHGKVAGALTIYSSQTDAFHEHEEEVGLLSSLANNLAYGIHAIRIHKEHERAAEELKSYTEKLEQSNQALQDFASIASHDMQEPLRKIIAFGDQLNWHYGEVLGEQGRDYLGRMQNAAERMQNLLNSLLNYARVTTRASSLVPVNLSELIREVLDDLEVRISETRGKVEAGALPEIEADPNQICQLFQNLIGNALKYHAEREPLVKVYGELVDEGRSVGIYVEDNGIGFEEKYAERIFKPFQRLHSHSSEYEGTGMGLAICKKIVERHGGSITVRSNQGQGSTFIINLPVKQSRVKEG